jgi:CubicO group peptidase (beta-lactamase class C family)
MTRLLCGVVAGLFVVSIAFADETTPTGFAPPGAQAIDKAVQESLETHKIPGAAVAVAVNGKLVLARGYGFADIATRQRVEPTSLFNLASCTKPFTAAAVLKLVDQGKLKLDDHVYRLLSDVIKLPAGVKIDERYDQITVRQMLHHAAGLRRDGRNLGKMALEEYVGENMRDPLDYDPGTKTVYSNLGFIILRLVVKHAAGEDYERFTQGIVLKPCGISDMRLDSVAKGYLKGEVHRYIADREKALPGGQGDKSEEEGGCWTASAVDVMRFMTALDGSRGKRLVTLESYKEMLSPLPPPFVAKNRYNGLGWDGVEHVGNRYFYEKNGGIAGIATYMEHEAGGVNFAILFNASPAKKEPGNNANAWRKNIIDAIHQFKEWPKVDYFDKFQ